jgi:dihydrofolate reductase
VNAARRSGATEIMVIGGAGIYALALPQADRIYLTEVHAEPDGDTVFPTYDRAEWTETARTRQKAAPGDTADYSFVILDRKKPAV